MTFITLVFGHMTSARLAGAHVSLECAVSVQNLCHTAAAYVIFVTLVFGHVTFVTLVTKVTCDLVPSASAHVQHCWYPRDSCHASSCPCDQCPCDLCHTAGAHVIVVMLVVTHVTSAHVTSPTLLVST